jgi:hypothetical protein
MADIHRKHIFVSQDEVIACRLAQKSRASGQVTRWHAVLAKPRDLGPRERVQLKKTPRIVRTQSVAYHATGFIGI